MINRKAEKIFALYRTLMSMYGPQGWWPLMGEEGIEYHVGRYDYPRNRLEVFEICIGAILTQNTTFLSVVKSLQNLKAIDALSPEGVSALDSETFREAIRPSGYFNQKAKYILAFIDFFMELGEEIPGREALLGVLGIGEETADSILLYAYKQEEFVIDAYTRRILHVLGYIGEKASYGKIKEMMEEALELMIGERSRVIVYQEFHALIVQHAKQFYTKKPYGARCPVANRRPDSSEEVFGNP